MENIKRAVPDITLGLNILKATGPNARNIDIIMKNLAEEGCVQSPKKWNKNNTLLAKNDKIRTTRK